MKKIKICIIILIIIIVCLTAVFLTNINKNSKSNNSTNEIANESIKPKLELNEIKAASINQTISDCINKYLTGIKDGDSQIYKILIADFIQSNNIDKNNVTGKLPSINYECDYMIDKVYEYETDLVVKTYFVNGYILNKDEHTKESSNFTINIDLTNNTFEIAPFEETYKSYIKVKDGSITEISEDLKTEIKSIEENDYNQIKIYAGFDRKQLLNYYFKQYIVEMIYNTENAYELLDNSYKTGRFEDYDEFYSYVKENIKELERSIVVKYKTEEYDDYEEYLCIDNYNNYYIFIETKPMEYKVLLDQYTIDDQIFVDQYNKKQEHEKAQLNLNKFCQMLNRKDYSSAYKVLNEEFKEKYFDTEEKFSNYIKENLYKYNQFSYEEILRDGEQYKIKTRISNVDNSFQENITKRFKVEIVNANEYKISFDI